MRWDIIGLVIGWTLRIFSAPLVFVGIYSWWWVGEGLDFVLKTYLITFIIALILSQSLIRYGYNSQSNN